MEQPKAHAYYPGLDLLRFAAALLVMMFHFLFLPWATNNNGSVAFIMAGGPMDFTYLRPLAWQGWVGVQVFFVISGLVIAASAEGRSAATFARSRAVRLLPTIFICATLSALVGVALPIQKLPELLRLYMGTLLVYPHGLNAVYWTLRIEIIFYLLVFLLLWRDKLRWLEPAAIMLTILNAIYWSLHYIDMFWPNYVASVHDAIHILHKCGIARELWFHYGCFFAIGIFMWKAAREGATRAHYIWGFIAILAGCAQIADFSTPFARLSEVRWPLAHLAPVAVWLASLPAMLLAIQWRCDGASTYKLRAIRILGLSTYPLYLLHDYSGAALLGMLYHVGCSPTFAASLAMLTCIVVAMIIAIFIEPPLARLLMRGLTPRREPA